MKQLTPKDILKIIPEEQLAELDYFKNRGESFIERCFIDDVQGVRERAYSDYIKESVENTCTSNFIRSTCKTDREREVALSVFQWLSTNCGRGSIEQAITLADNAEKEYLEGKL